MVLDAHHAKTLKTNGTKNANWEDYNRTRDAFDAVEHPTEQSRKKMKAIETAMDQAFADWKKAINAFELAVRKAGEDSLTLRCRLHDDKKNEELHAVYENWQPVTKPSAPQSTYDKSKCGIYATIPNATEKGGFAYTKKDSRPLKAGMTTEGWEARARKKSDRYITYDEKAAWVPDPEPYEDRKKEEGWLKMVERLYFLKLRSGCFTAVDEKDDKCENFFCYKSILNETKMKERAQEAAQEAMDFAIAQRKEAEAEAEPGRATIGSEDDEAEPEAKKARVGEASAA